MRYAANAKQRPLMPVELICKADGLPMPTPEYKFCESRKWRFDWCWPEQRIALEIEGGVFTRGRHTRPMGFLKDMDKYNAAASMGYKVFRCTPNQIHLGMQLIRSAIEAGGAHADTPVVNSTLTGGSPR